MTDPDRLFQPDLIAASMREQAAICRGNLCIVLDVGLPNPLAAAIAIDTRGRSTKCLAGRSHRKAAIDESHSDVRSQCVLVAHRRSPLRRHYRKRHSSCSYSALEKWRRQYGSAHVITIDVDAYPGARPISCSEGLCLGRCFVG